MALSFEYSMSSLLCAEEHSTIFTDDIDDDDQSSSGNCYKDKDDDIEICNQWSLVNQIQIKQTQQCLISSMLDKETQFLPGLTYFNRLTTGDLDLLARKSAIHWIQKVQSHYNFGPLCLCLSINYLDRFFSVYELPQNGKTWMMQLLAVACLSIAAKMEESEVPLSLDLQVGDAKFVFEAKAIQRMELLVLSTLKWRMQSITPFSFIDYFLYKINGNQLPPSSSISQSIDLILTIIKGIEFLEFKPSEIAAAVAICVTKETEKVDILRNPFSFLDEIELVQKEKVRKCVEMIHDMRLKSGYIEGSGSRSVPQSPIGVLDAAAACLSYNNTEDASTASASCSNSAHNDNTPLPPPPKRRKLLL